MHSTMRFPSLQSIQSKFAADEPFPGQRCNRLVGVSFVFLPGALEIIPEEEEGEENEKDVEQDSNSSDSSSTISRSTLGDSSVDDAESSDFSRHGTPESIEDDSEVNLDEFSHIFGNVGRFNNLQLCSDSFTHTKAVKEEARRKAQRAAVTLRSKRLELQISCLKRTILNPGAAVPQRFRQDVDKLAREARTKKPLPGKSRLCTMWTPETMAGLSRGYYAIAPWISSLRSIQTSPERGFRCFVKDLVATSTFKMKSSARKLGKDCHERTYEESERAVGRRREMQLRRESLKSGNCFRGQGEVVKEIFGERRRRLMYT